MRSSSSGVAALVVALDLVLGEPPPAVHPTIWMGRGFAAGRARRQSQRRAPGMLLEGAAVTLGVVGLAALGGYLVDVGTRGGGIGRTLGRSVALKPALALRGLLAASVAVERALRAGHIDRARSLLGYHLVSRDTTALSPSEIAGATIASLAENLSDSVVAPLVAFRWGGLSAAYAYRALNTADAMFGYRTPDLEWFGKVAARGDDVANVVPARLAAVLIAGAAPLAGGSVRRAAGVAWRDARHTPSHNAGWPMAAMAGALDVSIEKRGVYRLNERGRPPGIADIARARLVVLAAAALAVAAVELA